MTVSDTVNGRTETQTHFYLKGSHLWRWRTRWWRLPTALQRRSELGPSAQSSWWSHSPAALLPGWRPNRPHGSGSGRSGRACSSRGPFRLPGCRLPLGLQEARSLWWSVWKEDVTRPKKTVTHLLVMVWARQWEDSSSCGWHDATLWNQIIRDEIRSLQSCLVLSFHEICQNVCP